MSRARKPARKPVASRHGRQRDRFAEIALAETMRGMPVRQDEPEYPLVVAQTAWKIANAMELGRRSARGGRP